MHLKKIYRYIRIYVIRLLARIVGTDLNLRNLNQKILILAPHPDDEVLGCAGLIQHLNVTGKEVYVAILTNGENSLQHCEKDEIIQARKASTLKAAEILNLKNIHWCNMKDGNIGGSPREPLLDYVDELKPDAIFVPHYLEGWPDHEATEKIGLELIASMPHLICYHYCIWFWFSMPYTKFAKVQWKNAKILSMSNKEHQHKLRAIRVYTEEKSLEGEPYSGNLPDEFLYANRWNKELFFEIKK